MRSLPLFALVALVACTPPAPEQPETPASTPPAVAACNAVAPDLSRLVSVTDGEPASTPAAELRGGRIAPGTYDLVSAARISGATGWSGARAVALEIAEGDAGVVINWAGAEPGGRIDTWTASLTEAPRARLAFTCGRIGEVDASFSAQADTLELRIQDGASGALHMSFTRRG